MSKHINIASKCVNIARVNVLLHKYCIMVAQASYASARGRRRAVIFVFFIAKIAEFFDEIALKNIEKRNSINNLKDIRTLQ